jgi:cytochrome c peroxidase
MKIRRTAPLLVLAALLAMASGCLEDPSTTTRPPGSPLEQSSAVPDDDDGSQFDDQSDEDDGESDAADESELHSGGHAALIAEVRALIAARGITPTPPPPPVSDALYELGQALAFDKILGGNRDISCMTCHHPAVGTDDDRHLPRGAGGHGLGFGRAGGPIIPRNAPALFNLHEYTTMFWDSRVERNAAGDIVTPAGAQLTAEMKAALTFGVVAAQAMFPVVSREEMRGLPGQNEIANIPDGDFQGVWQALMQRLGAIPEYVAMFEAAYPGVPFEDMSFAHAANAIAGFEIRAFAALDSPWEQFVAGDDQALGKAQLQGAKTFFDEGCGSCHSGRAFSNFRHHNTGLAQLGPGAGAGPTSTDDFGREHVTGAPADRYRFRTTPLVNVALTGPYGHSGQYADLRDFVMHYDDPVRKLQQYDVTEHVYDEDLHSLVVQNRDAVIAGISTSMAGVRFKKKHANKMVSFLEALTAESSLYLWSVVPEHVPSGLPVED